MDIFKMESGSTGPDFFFPSSCHKKQFSVLLSILVASILLLDPGDSIESGDQSSSSWQEIDDSQALHSGYQWCHSGWLVEVPGPIFLGTCRPRGVSLVKDLGLCGMRRLALSNFASIYTMVTVYDPLSTCSGVYTCQVFNIHHHLEHAWKHTHAKVQRSSLICPWLHTLEMSVLVKTHGGSFTGRQRTSRWKVVSGWTVTARVCPAGQEMII